MDEKYIHQISQEVFKENPLTITRKKIGICNEVYELGYPSSSVILRLNTQKNLLYGTHKFLPLFKELGIPTPDILAEDYSLERFPYCYQILTKIAGEDLGLVIHKITYSNLKQIATEISHIFDQFNTLPAKHSFGGLLGMHEEHFSSLLEVVENQRSNIVERNKNTQVVDHETLDILDQLIDEYKEYFLHAKPKLYYDDISSKNVMIHNEQFAGLVDLDFLRKGDYLEVLGAIMATWHGEAFGDIYLNEIIRKQRLNEFQQNLIKFYAMLHLTLWSSEEGMRFNANTTGTINWENVKRKKTRIIAIFNEIKK